MTARYAIGIDLGTTNSVMAAVPLDSESGIGQVVPIPQLVAAMTTENRTELPSFAFLPAVTEDRSIYALPWESEMGYCVGEIARLQSAIAPERTVGSAKSWLAFHHVDRQQPLLPWDAPDEIEKISPVTASTHYLQHLRQAWDHDHPDAPLREQIVGLTVPASFDASARELTREAAAGLPEQVTLLEEPQAAVYAWLADQEPHWRKTLGVGDRLLVCDVGGGTTDLSLIEVVEREGELHLERLAVGNHLLVGGDNMDLLLAHEAAARFEQQGVSLDPWQSVSLWHACRRAKETLLQPSGPESYSLSILGRGTKLIGGTVSLEMRRDDVQRSILDGFFPPCSLLDRPQAQRQSGFLELGLPYELDTAITKHVARFLGDHATSPPRPPTHVLFNGGVFRSTAFQRRILETLAAWFPEQPPVTLDSSVHLDHSVARGAAYCAWTQTHGGVRIRGGTARSYYVGFESTGLAVPGASRPLHALCVVPFGMEEGTSIDVPSREIGLLLGESARFRFFSSSVRQQDAPGKLLTRWGPNELEETDSLETMLTRPAECTEQIVPIRFQARVTEIGTLELWCVSTIATQRWKLEFSVRDPA
ncbi:MAG: Hsp70 family protein [Planctomycetota bacterium]|nr:Hsp70 family protein [Planctomycetota bacterium]